ncbi:DNA repair protein RadC [Marinobacterium sp. MBR-111]|jgi:DNA repair protein RadC
MAISYTYQYCLRDRYGEDWRIQPDRLQQALSTVEIRLLDHVIVAHEGTCSFAEKGLI